MTSKLLLARHGNTFLPGEKAVFAGSRNDLPLTDEGRAQAKETGLLFARLKAVPSLILTGPLLRTREFGAIAAAEIKGAPAPLIDRRLDELDYGAWAGLTSEEIVSKFGAVELADWNERAQWPKDAQWPEDEAAFIEETEGFVAEMRSRNLPLILAVTSNGRLRYFPKSFPGEFERLRDRGELKVKTGHLGLLNLDGREAGVAFWNRDPRTVETL